MGHGSSGSTTSRLLLALAAACGTPAPPAPEPVPEKLPPARGLGSADPWGYTAEAELSALDPVARKALRIELAFLGLDAALQAVRIEWRGPDDTMWDWPKWLDDLEGRLDRLVALAAETPPVPALDDALRAYVTAMRPDALALRDVVRAWRPVEADPAATRPSPETVRALFERLGRTSQPAYAVLAPYRASRRPARGSGLAMHDVCLHGAALLVTLPGAAPQAEAASTVFAPATPLGELRTRGVACMRAVVDFAEATPELEPYLVGLANDIGLGLVIEADRARSPGRAYVSWSSNIAQNVTYLSQRSPFR